MGVNLFGEIRGQNPRLLIKRISHMLPFLLAILTFIFLVWSGYYVLNFPYDGFFVNSRTGNHFICGPIWTSFRKTIRWG